MSVKIPKSLYVSGAPLSLAGFNGEYKIQHSAYSNDFKWSCDPHMFFGIFIPAAIIEKRNETWILRANDRLPDAYYNDCYDSKFNTESKLPPIGKWHYFHVDTEHRPMQEFLRSYGHLLALMILIVPTLFYLSPLFFQLIVQNIDSLLALFIGLFFGATLFKQ